MKMLEVAVYHQKPIHFVSEGMKICMVLKGNTRFIKNQEVLECPEDTIIVCNTEDEIEADPTDLFVILTPTWPYFQSLDLYDYNCCSLIDENAMMKKFKKLLKRTLRFHFDSHIDLYRQTQNDIELLNFLRQHYAIPKIESMDLKHKVRVYMFKNSRNSDCTLEKAAQEFGFSSAYFSRWFAQNFDISFIKYLNRIRTENAAKDLAEEEGNLLKIALNAGFPNLNSFQREFRRYYNCTPGEYRSQILAQSKQVDLSGILNDIELDEIQKENEWNAEIEMGTTKEAFRHTFVNALMPLGSISAFSKEHQILSVQQALQKLNIKKVQLEFDGDIHHTSTFSQEQIVFDILVEQKILPILTFPFRKYGDNSFFPFIERFLNHFANRYGKDYLQCWILEIEYDSAFDQGEEVRYCNWIRHLKETIKKLNFTISIYGPRLHLDKQGKNLRTLLKNHPAIDAITLSCAPYSIEKIQEEWTVCRNTSPDYLASQYQISQAVAQEYGYFEVYVTKWQDTIFSQTILNDVAFRAARTCQLLLNSYQKVPSLPTPILLDSLASDNDSLFSGQEGMVCRRQIPKPICWLYSFWKHTDRYLLYYDNHLLITYDNEKYLQIICHNVKELSWENFMKSVVDHNKVIADYFIDQEKLHVKISLKGNFHGRYIMKTRIINEEVGNPYVAWTKMKVPDSFLGKSELQYLQGIAQPGIESQILETKEGILSLDFLMNWNEIRHIHLITYYE